MTSCRQRKEVLMSVGRRIAALRRERDLSQAELAAATGVSRSAVAQWETDRVGQVRENLSRIAAVLDVSVEVLLHGDAARGGETLTGDELALLRLYRRCGGPERTALVREARRLVRLSGEP
jgi:transcriptional regulator with XRE-family HTH domain